MTTGQSVKWPFNFFDLKSSLHSNKWGTFSIGINSHTFAQRNAVANKICRSKLICVQSKY